jgi:hypothetical protein
MLQCGLIKENKSKKWKTIHIKPCIEMGNYSSYSWSNFIAEYKLNIETSYICIEGAKVYFICITSFACATKLFRVLDQIHGGMKFKYTTIRDRQKTFIEATAKEEIFLLSSSSIISSNFTTTMPTARLTIHLKV